MVRGVCHHRGSRTGGRPWELQARRLRGGVGFCLGGFWVGEEVLGVGWEDGRSVTKK